MEIRDFLSRLQGVKSAGTNKWTAHCPCTQNHKHGDMTNSLSVSVENGKILLHCFVGCTTEDIVHSMGLELRDLMPEPTPQERRMDSIQWMANSMGMKFICEYNYSYGPYASDGLYKVRFEGSKGKSFRWIVADPNSGSGYRWKEAHKGLPPRLYCAGNIKDDTVVVVEGEKDADTVHKVWKMTGVSAENGATKGDAGSKWHEEYTRQLEGKTVYILSDNDAPGKHFAEIEADALWGHAAHVYVLDITEEWTDCPEKADVSDMVKILGPAEAVKILDSLKDKATERIYDPLAAFHTTDAENTAPDSEKPTGDAQKATDKKKSSIELFDDFIGKIQTEAFKPMRTGMPSLDSLLNGGIMRQSLAILNAAPAAGKTTLAQQIFEGMAANEDTDVLFLNLEMSREQLLARSLSRIAHRQGHRITSAEIMRGYKWTDTQRKYVQDAAEEYKQRIAPRMHYNPDDVGTDLDAIRDCLNDNARKIKAEGRQAPVVVLDYLHLVTSASIQDAQSMTKEVVSMLKSYALRWDSFVFAISANNRIANSSGKISLDAGRDSSALEYSADVQLSLNYKALHKGKDDNGKKVSAADPDDMAKLQNEKPRHMMVQVLKQRMGATGKILDLDFDAENSIFYPVDRFNKAIPQDDSWHGIDEVPADDIPYI